MIWPRIRQTLSDGRAVRLAGALLCGLLLGFAGNKIGTGMQNVVPFLLFPLLVGGAAALTIGARAGRPYLMALCTGLCCWVGITIYLLVQLAGSAPCTPGTCSLTTVLKTLLTLYLLAGFILVALGSLATCATTRYLRRSRDPAGGLPR